MPFRLYANYGKHKVSFGYKLPNSRWAFRLSAPAHNKEALAEIRKQAIERAEALNGDAVEPGTFEALAELAGGLAGGRRAAQGSDHARREPP
ncbi:hypothetical protein [Burkholderia cepacia]|uniref:hypothetical protein n=1 Tax=Burkholderia cepacia TaxID=292 RepID=UPI00398F05F4